MFIETPAKLNDVVTIKMIGGDEIVGRLNDERMDDYIELNKPHIVMMAQQGFGLMPYILTAGPDVKAKIDRRHVITIVKTLDQVAKQYMKQSTGLEI
jgi:hypothetical protein